MSEKASITDTVSIVGDETVYKIPLKTENAFQLEQNDSLSNTLAYLDKTYSQKIWRSSQQNNTSNGRKRFRITNFKTAFNSLIEILYEWPNRTPAKHDQFPHLLPLKSLYVTGETISIDYDITGRNNLRDLLLYSPRSIDSYDKILFILYQLLKLVKHLNSLNLNIGEISLTDIYLDQKYWVQVKLPISSILNLYKCDKKANSAGVGSIRTKITSDDESDEDSNEEDSDQEEDDSTSIHSYCISASLIRQSLSDVYDSYRHLNHHDLANITKSWTNSKISNFDYLLMLNSIAGRKLDCPFNHPIFPWISDFTSLNTNLRDLSMSKFRLNKGDPHLDLIYQASANTPTGPYHLTEFLSEITYFVYKARVTDKATLCQHVRRNWVPNEYPVSMNRLYLWTPEECIPEFFCDPSIFVSIHDDLPDLRTPDWCNGSVDEFIRTHRLLLDSDLVSKKLHNWIDLVFGFKLSGEASVEAKNVCLPLIDNHQTMKPFGIAQLFILPHPNKSIDKIYNSDKPPKIKNKSRTLAKQAEFFYDGEFRAKTSSFINNPNADYNVFRARSSASRPDNGDYFNIQVSLPDDYNPLAPLEQMETLLKFTNKAYHCMPDFSIKEKSDRATFEELARSDLKCIASVLCEIILFNKIKCLPENNSLSTRYSFLCKEINQEPHIIFGPFLPFIVSVLKPFDNLAGVENTNIVKSSRKKSTKLSGLLSSSSSATQSTTTKSKLSFFHESLIKYQAEMITIDSLFNTHLSVLPFKSYFEVYYKFSEIYHRLDFLIDEFAELNQQSLQKMLYFVTTQMENLNNKVFPIMNLSASQQNPSATSQSRRTLSNYQSRASSNSLISYDDDGLPKFKEESPDLSNEPMASNDLLDPAGNVRSESIFNDVFRNEYSSDLFKIDTVYEQKFYFSLFYIPNIMFSMSDPKRNQLAQSICMTTSSNYDFYELILPYVIDLYEDPATCVNSFIFLFNKLAKFFNKNELLNKLLPILLHVLNVVDLNETVGIDLWSFSDEEKIKFCKLFEYSFMNELRITFGLKLFLTQICPFLVEAISGFKDFDFDDNSTKELIEGNSLMASSSSTSIINEAPVKSDTNENSGKAVDASPVKETTTTNLKKPESDSDKKKKSVSAPHPGAPRLLVHQSALDHLSPIFDMENMAGGNNELNAVIEEMNESQEDEKSTSNASLDNSRETVGSGKDTTGLTTGSEINELIFKASPVPSSLPTTSSRQTRGIQSKQDNEESKLTNRINFVDAQPVKDEKETSEGDRASLSSLNSLNKGSNVSNKSQPLVNISTTAFDTFTKLIPVLGPVLTCKYCCADLLKMLAICYMNTKCLSVMESGENPLNSIRPLEGDRFAHLILESLKSVASLYGEQVIVLQYFTHVSNTVTACSNRVSIRSEASLLAGLVLVNFFLSYLNIKQLLDNLSYILNTIIMPVINLYSNDKIKFPNGSAMRQSLSFKVLDIMLIISLRIGPEQTRIEMERVMKSFFSGFSLVRSNVMSSISKPLVIEKMKNTLAPDSNRAGLARGAFKARASIVSFNYQRQYSTSKENVLLNNSGSISILDKDNLSEEMNSYDEYLKLSYDQSTNEIVGSSLKTGTSKRLSLAGSSEAYKYRTQSFGLLSLNNEENESQATSAEQSTSQQMIKNASPHSKSNLVIDEEMLSTFTVELAHTAYYGITRLTSGNYIDSILPNADLIHRMCWQNEHALRKQAASPQQTSAAKSVNPRMSSKPEVTVSGISSSISGINIVDTKKHTDPNKLGNKSSSSYSSSFSENVSIVGNQIQIESSNTNPTPTNLSQSDYSVNLPTLNNAGFKLKFSDKELKSFKSSLDTSRHLSDNWLAYWENEIRSNDKSDQFDFKHINLLTLSGHSSAVRSIYALDNESSIISCSKDKTVKLWTLRNHGGSQSMSKRAQQTCQWSYNHHKKPVNSVLYIESLNVCASCDGSVHVWNPFSGRRLFQLDTHLVTCMANLPSPSTSFIVATNDNMVKFVDLRQKSYAYELKTFYTPSGSIKTIACSDNQLLIGFSTGLMYLIDMRTGWIIESSKHIDNEILQMKFYSSDKFACTYNDGSISISTIKDKIQLQNLIKVYNEPVPYLNVNQNQMITGTNSNKIGIHSNLDKTAQLSFSSNKLQPDSFKGILSSLNYLPLNRLLLIGSDNGDIKLFC